jgi:peptidoglycan LD-endopeptidase LytH
MRVQRLGICAALLLAACGRIADQLHDRNASRSAHERYRAALVDAGLGETALGRDWMAASRRALETPTLVTLPYREVGYFAPHEARATGYRADVKDGQRLVVDVARQGSAAALFVDVFRVTGDSARPFDLQASADSTGAPVAVESRRAGTYIVRVQPELLRSAAFAVTIHVEPTLAFPVSGRNSRAVQSFFGAPRDGGSRAHHGIDIFAARGTPVVAAADGYIASISPNNLGGNVIWQRDTKRGQTLYYAHLDRHAVAAGATVHVGDTIGFVGNTGNARTTPPHLHFGIYRRGAGPVDPFAFVVPPRGTLSPLVADTATLGDLLRTTARAPIRLSPSDADAALTLDAGTPVRVDAATGSWYRVRLPDGGTGYLAARLTGPLARERQQTRLAAGTPIRERPAPDAAIVTTTREAGSLAVLGRYDRFVLVATDDGREGWVEGAE